MPVSNDYLAYARELLRELEPISTRRMFGGVGVYSGEHFFAILVDDALYLKADDGNRPAFEREGLTPSATPARTAVPPP